MASLTIAGRLISITMVLLLGLWIAVVSNFYLSDDWKQEDYWPQPKRIAAITALLKKTPTKERADIVEALSSQGLKVWVETDIATEATVNTVRQANEQLMKRYASVLSGYAFTISDVSLPPAQNRFFQIGRKASHAIEFRIGVGGGDTIVMQSIPPIALTSFGLPVGIGAGAIATMIALSALVVLYREIGPLRQLARAINKMDLDGQIVPIPNVRGRSTEIRALVTAFDRLQTRLSQVLRSRMAMLGGISHDVRTYATRLRLRAELIPSDVQRVRAIEDISDMIRLLDDALLAARVGANDLAEELLDLSEIVRNEVENRRSLGASLVLVLPLQKEVSVLGDQTALKRVVANIIDNAIKYGQSAEVQLDVRGVNAILTIGDTGPGIPVELVDLLMEPFVRVEISRGRDTGGAGLGLAIVRNLVEAHGGTVDIRNRSPHGLQVSVIIPIFMG